MNNIYLNNADELLSNINNLNDIFDFRNQLTIKNEYITDVYKISTDGLNLIQQLIYNLETYTCDSHSQNEMLLKLQNELRYDYESFEQFLNRLYILIITLYESKRIGYLTYQDYTYKMLELVKIYNFDVQFKHNDNDLVYWNKFQLSFDNITPNKFLELMRIEYIKSQHDCGKSFKLNEEIMLYPKSNDNKIYLFSKAIDKHHMNYYDISYLLCSNLLKYNLHPRFYLTKNELFDIIDNIISKYIDENTTNKIVYQVGFGSKYIALIYDYIKTKESDKFLNSLLGIRDEFPLVKMCIPFGEEESLYPSVYNDTIETLRQNSIIDF